MFWSLDIDLFVKLALLLSRLDFLRPIDDDTLSFDCIPCLDEGLDVLFLSVNAPFVGDADPFFSSNLLIVLGPKLFFNEVLDYKSEALFLEVDLSITGCVALT